MEDIFKQLCEQIKTEMVSAINYSVNEVITANKLQASKIDLELLTKKEAAKFLGISAPTLDKLIEDGVVTSHRLGGSIRLKKHELEASLTERKFSKFKKQKGYENK